MAPTPKKPSEGRVRRAKPLRDWEPSSGRGWQHGDIPAPPPDLSQESIGAWDAWFKSWWASHWTEGDIPGLRLTIMTFDAVVRGHKKMSDITPLMDSHGITPKGRKQLLWLAPSEGEEEEPGAPAAEDEIEKAREARKRRVAGA